MREILASDVIASPHAHGGGSVGLTMRRVMIALTPATLFGLWLFGWPAINLFLITLGSCLLFEFASQRLMGQPLLHVGAALTKHGAGSQLKVGAGALSQTQQVRLERRGQLPAAHCQGGWTAVKGVDDIACRAAETVVQGQERVGLNGSAGVCHGSGLDESLLSRPVQIACKGPTRPPEPGQRINCGHCKSPPPHTPSLCR